MKAPLASRLTFFMFYGAGLHNKKLKMFRIESLKFTIYEVIYLTRPALELRSKKKDHAPSVKRGDLRVLPTSEESALTQNPELCALLKPSCYFFVCVFLFARGSEFGAPF
jgi:hypothetical protein